MKRVTHRMMAAAACFVAVPAMVVSLRSQQGSAAPGETVTILVSFGLTARAAEDWSGSVRLTRAKLLRIAGRHLPAGGSVRADGSWTCLFRPGSAAPEAPPLPAGVLLTVEAGPRAAIEIRTRRANFAAGLNELAPEPRRFANGGASVRIVPSPELLSAAADEDDEPSIAALPDGSIAVSWVAYHKEAERVLVRIRRPDGRWDPPEQVSDRPADIFRTSLAAAADGTLWVVWAERDDGRWKLWMRRKPKGGSWTPRRQLSGAESATFHRAATDGKRLYVVWQGFFAGQSDIYYGASDGDAWSGQTRVSSSAANDWEPAVAVSPQGLVYIVWDSYDRGNYDIFFRLMGTGMPPQAVTNSPRFQAHASVAVDSRNRPWVAWDESGVDWGKGPGLAIPVPAAMPLHGRRRTRVAVFSGYGWDETAAAPPHLDFNAEHPQLAIAGSGAVTMLFRHSTREPGQAGPGAPVWENYITHWDGVRWSDPQPLPASAGPIEKHAQLARDASGRVWAAWMADNRTSAAMVPGNAEVMAARLTAAPKARGEALVRYAEPVEETAPAHRDDRAAPETVRNYTIVSGGRKYRILRGDLHLHSELSRDSGSAGSLFEVYRYALDAAALDFVAVTDHQAGHGQEFAWWQGQKYADLFLLPERFLPLFAYEWYGHRNLVWARRGVRPLPVPPEEASARVGPAKQFDHLRATGGVSIPHSTASSQGTNWRGHDPGVESLVELFQGGGNGSDDADASRAATETRLWWNALDSGHKLGVVASGGPRPARVGYACVLAEDPSREGLLDAIRKRHSYAATGNIILDFRARDESTENLQGDVFTASGPAVLSVRVIGTGVIRQVDVIGNRRLLHTVRPNAKEAAFEYVAHPENGENWYHVRVLQEDGQRAWSSPVWITFR